MTNLNSAAETEKRMMDMFEDLLWKGYNPEEIGETIQHTLAQARLDIERRCPADVAGVCVAMGEDWEEGW